MSGVYSGSGLQPPIPQQVLGVDNVTLTTKSGIAGLNVISKTQYALAALTNFAVGKGANLTVPNDGQPHLVIYGGAVVIQTVGSASINVEASYTDESNTARGTDIVPLSTDAGTAVTAATTAANYQGIKVAWVMPNTTIQVFLGGTTATLFDATVFVALLY